MKRLHVLLGMLVLVAGWWGWVEYRKPREWREPTRGVRGRVVDVHGDPVRGCAVSIEKRDEREMVMLQCRWIR